MHPYQQHFIETALRQKALRFGEFTLKSGRVSPYFFNAGLFSSGASLATLAEAYANTIVHSDIEFDMMFGPAYKGIPLVSATAICLAQTHDRDYPYCFNRKEAKDHGEGGSLVGAPLVGRVLLIDDVITAGTAYREAKQIVDDVEAELAGVLVALDRQERGLGKLSAIQEIEQRDEIPVESIIRLEHLMEYLQETGAGEDLEKLAAYRKEYGV